MFQLKYHKQKKKIDPSAARQQTKYPRAQTDPRIEIYCGRGIRMEEHVVTMAARRKSESRSSSWGGLNSEYTCLAGSGRAGDDVT
jgi:hypothetical protein